MTEATAQPTTGGRPPGPSVTARALSVLEAFSASRPTLTLADLQRRTGLPLTTTQRLVRELTAWGALERGPDGRYGIGLRLWEVASLARRVSLREAALPFMEDIYEVTHENVQLAVLDAGEVVFVERIAGRHAVEVRTRVGGRFPVHATGVGLLLLGYASSEVQEAVLRGPLERFTPRTLTDPAALRRVLADVRSTGVAVSDRQVTLDAVSVAAPVFGPGDEVIAALSVVADASRARPASLEPLVRAAALGTSRRLVARRRRDR